MTSASVLDTLATPSLHETYSSLRTLSNKTYLRRVYIKISDAQRLFFGAPETLFLPALFMQEPGAARYAPNKTILRTVVSLLDAEGRLWPVQYECVLQGGQRHSRLKSGWMKVCRANHFTVGDRIRFQRLTLRDRTSVIKVDKIASV